MRSVHSRHPAQSASGGTALRPALRALCGRAFLLVTGINFVAMSVYYLTFVTSAAHARAAYDLSLSRAALTAGALVIGCLAGRFASGNLISRTGCKGMLLGGLALFTASLAAFFLVQSAAALFVQRFAAGVGIGMTSTATGTIVAVIVPHEHHGLGISVFSMSTALALAAGPFAGILLSDALPYAQVVLGTVAAAACCLGLALPVPPVAVGVSRLRPLYRLDSYIDPRAVRFSLLALLFCFSYGSVQVFLTTYAAERHLSDAASLFFLCYAATAIVTRPLTGRLFDRYGERRLLAPLFLLTALALCLLAQASSGAVLLAAGCLLGMGFGNFQSVGQAAVISRVTRSRFAQATTTFFIFFDCGIGIGPYLYGLLIPDFGYTGMFYALAATVTAILALSRPLLGRDGSRP